MTFAATPASSGNMNLGLVVLSANNELFQASLVTSVSLATTFTLPTIGLFRISLVEPTVFQLRGGTKAD